MESWLVTSSTWTAYWRVWIFKNVLFLKSILTILKFRNSSTAFAWFLFAKDLHPTNGTGAAVWKRKEEPDCRAWNPNRHSSLVDCQVRWNIENEGNVILIRIFAEIQIISKTRKSLTLTASEGTTSIRWHCWLLERVLVCAWERTLLCFKWKWQLLQSFWNIA